MGFLRCEIGGEEKRKRSREHIFFFESSIVAAVVPTHVAPTCEPCRPHARDGMGCSGTDVVLGAYNILHFRAIFDDLG